MSLRMVRSCPSLRSDENDGVRPVRSRQVVHGCDPCTARVSTSEDPGASLAVGGQQCTQSTGAASSSEGDRPMSGATPVCELLGIEHPIVLAPLAVDPRLPAAVSNAGGLGSLGLSWSDD